MKALIAVKHVIDYNVKVHIKTDRSDVDINNIRISMNPFDEVAVEETVRLKEAGKVNEVIAVSLGDKKCEETLRTTLAMGADRTVHIETDKGLEPLAATKLLEALADKENPQILLLDKQAIDNNANQTVQMLPALLNVAQGIFASKVEPNADEVLVTHEINGSEEMLVLRLPTMTSADSRLSEPCFVKLPNIMQAKKRLLEKLSPEELGISAVPLIRTIKVAEPGERQASTKVSSVTELAGKLGNEAKVI